MMNTQAVVHIRKGEARSLKAGGMWIYDNEIERIEGEFENGDILRVEDFDGYPLGCGFITPAPSLPCGCFPAKRILSSTMLLSKCASAMPGNTAVRQLIPAAAA